MNEHEAERLLERYSDSLDDEQAFSALRPPVRERVISFGTRVAQHRKRHRHLRFALYGGGPLALAACVALLFWPRQPDFGLTVFVAGDPDHLFARAGGSAPAHDQFWIGVDVQLPCWIHVVECTRSGELVVAYPQRSSESYALYVTDRTQLGPFRVVEQEAPAGPTAIEHILVIAAQEALSGETLAAALPDRLLPTGASPKLGGATRDLARSLRRAHGWHVECRGLNPSSDEPPSG